MYGENLYTGRGNGVTFSQGMNAWMDEAATYSYAKPGFNAATQLSISMIVDIAGILARWTGVGACELPAKDMVPNAGEIKRGYVHSDHQSQKLGSRVIQQMLSWLDEEGHSPLYIGICSENNGAHSF
ncbi:hypothetical protein BGZ67_006977 [Mortierella alpina]|nr:hypothetical protein BGZ67_006977 [Mortierella alpina]